MDVLDAADRATESACDISPQDHLDPKQKANNRWSSDKGKGSFGNLRWATPSQQQKENRKEKEKEIESEKTPQHLMDGEIAWYCPRPHPLSIIVNMSSDRAISIIASAAGDPRDVEHKSKKLVIVLAHEV